MSLPFKMYIYYYLAKTKGLKLMKTKIPKILPYSLTECQFC